MDKNLMLFERDEKGELMPQYIDSGVEELGKIKIIPLTRAQVKKIIYDISDNIDSNKDDEVILKCCLEPNFTQEEIKFLKPRYSSAIVSKILEISGVFPKENLSTTQNIKESEENLKKNLIQQTQG